MKTIIYALLVNSSLIAATFTPYVIEEQQNEVPKSSYQFNFSDSDLMNTSSTTINGVKLNFFSEITQLLEQSHKVKNTNNNSWPVHIKSNDSFEQKINDLINPASFIYKHDISLPYNVEDFNNLLGVIKNLVAPLIRESFDDSIITKDFLKRSKEILIRLQFQQMNRNWSSIKNEFALMKQENKTKEKSDLMTRALNFMNEAEFIYNKGLKENKRKYLHDVALTDDDRKLISIYIGGLAWRARGGGIVKATGTQAYRKDFAGKAFQQIFMMNSNNFKLSKKFSKAMVQRLQLKGWSQWYDMSQNHDSKFFDLDKMTKRGVFQIGIGSYFGPFKGKSAYKYFKKSKVPTSYLRAAGAQMGNCYFYSRFALENIFYAPHLKYPSSEFLHGHTSWGEVCFGATLGLALHKTFLK